MIKEVMLTIVMILSLIAVFGIQGWDVTNDSSEWCWKQGGSLSNSTSDTLWQIGNSCWSYTNRLYTDKETGFLEIEKKWVRIRKQ